MDVRDIATVRYLKALSLVVITENKGKTVSQLFIRRRVWTGNGRTQMMAITLGIKVHLT